MTLDPQQESIFKEYCEKHEEEHVEICKANANVQNRMHKAQERNPEGEDYDILLDFIDGEHDCCMSNSGKIIIYMPPRLYGEDLDLRGKIIIESTFSQEQIFFEIQLSKESDFSQVQEDFIKESAHPTIRRIHGLRLKREQGAKFVQDCLFLDRHRQRFLITSESKVIGSMTTQKLRSESGQLLAFRQCLLNE